MPLDTFRSRGLEASSQARAPDGLSGLPLCEGRDGDEGPMEPWRCEASSPLQQVTSPVGSDHVGVRPQKSPAECGSRRGEEASL